MEIIGMWGLTLIILKDIKCFQIWAYFEGIGINFNFENFQNKIFPLFILRIIFAVINIDTIYVYLFKTIPKTNVINH
jgi:hypothetical protein